MQGLNQDLETGYPRVAIVEFWGVLFFQGDHLIQKHSLGSNKIAATSKLSYVMWTKYAVWNKTGSGETPRSLRKALGAGEIHQDTWKNLWGSGETPRGLGKSLGAVEIHQTHVQKSQGVWGNPGSIGKLVGVWENSCRVWKTIGSLGETSIGKLLGESGVW